VIDADILDPTMRPFWEGVRVGEIRVQRCAACGSHQFYPRSFCMRCDGTDLAWVSAAGLGVVHSLVTVHLAVTDDLAPPYRVALVELAEGPRFLGLVAADVAIGDRVSGRWLGSQPGTARLLFEPAP
jgi:uncharacterized OB-fold protein